MNAHLTRIIVTVALLLIGPYGAFGQERQDDVLGIEELRVLAANRPVRVSSLRLSSDLFQDPSSFSADGHIAHMLRSVLVDATTGRFSMDRSMEIEGPEHDFGTQTVTITFDGEVQGAFLPDAMIGVVQEGTDTDGLSESGLWTVMMLGEPQPDGLGIDDGSLESLLAHGTVRDQLELVADTSCHVVDAFYQGVRYAAVWLDVERGLLPMKFVGYGGDGSASTTMTVDSVMYLEDEQVWLPRSWKTEIQARGETLRNYTVVDPQSVELDPPVNDEDFRPYFPPGTYVSDQISGQAYRITESGEIGEILYERLDDGEWVAVAEPIAAAENAGEDADEEALSPEPPIFENLAELMEYAARVQAAKRSENTKQNVEAGPASPTVATEQQAVDSTPPAQPARETALPADVAILDDSREQEPAQRPESDAASAGRAQPSKLRWRWIVGVTAVVALLAIGYAAWRRGPAWRFRWREDPNL